MLRLTTMTMAAKQLLLLLLITALINNVLSSALPPNCDPNQPEVSKIPFSSNTFTMQAKFSGYEFPSS